MGTYSCEARLLVRRSSSTIRAGLASGLGELSFVGSSGGGTRNEGRRP